MFRHDPRNPFLKTRSPLQLSHTNPSSASLLYPPPRHLLAHFHHRNQHASICFLHQRRDLVELQIMIVGWLKNSSVSKSYDRNKLRTPSEEAGRPLFPPPLPLTPLLTSSPPFPCFPCFRPLNPCFPPPPCQSPPCLPEVRELVYGRQMGEGVHAGAPAHFASFQDF